MAADERTHKRLESAYVELLQMIERAGYWADRVYPVWTRTRRRHRQTYQVPTSRRGCAH